MSQKELRYKELENRGIPEPELSRAVEAEFADGTDVDTIPEPWPGKVTGIDNIGSIDVNLIFSSKQPLQPISDVQTEPFPTHPSISSSSNWIGTASQMNAQPPSVGITSYNSHKTIPEFRYTPEQRIDIGPSIIIPPSGAFNETVDTKDKEKKSLWKKILPYIGIFGAVLSLEMINDYLNSAPDDTEEREKYYTHTPLQLYAKFTLSSTHKGKDVCDDYSGKVYDLMDLDRPILASEGKGYVNLTHPGCSCSWSIVKKPKTISTLNKSQQKEFNKIESHIVKHSKDHTLHTVNSDGTLSKRTRGTNPMQETIGKIRHEFKWLSDDYIESAKKAAQDNDGVLYLIRAASEVVTDHRSENEEYRRKLTGSELNAMARTAIGRKMDINHNPIYTTGASILDSEYDDTRKEIQMLVIETDPQINQFIRDGSITAVSINGGAPRTQDIEPCVDGCTDDTCELCNVPRGIVLAEVDGIALTFVVTDPKGIIYKGDYIPPAVPGMASTVLEAL